MKSEYMQGYDNGWMDCARAEKEDKCKDAVVEANIKLLRERSNVGVAKYGVTLAGADLTKEQLVQHALEEALDLANYLQALLHQIRK